MNCKMIAFVGSESYDMVHYLARTILAFGKRVLIVDKTIKGDMMATAPTSDWNGIFDYRGLHMTRSDLDYQTLDSSYDYVFYYCGYDVKSFGPEIEEVYFICDCQRQNILALKSIQLRPEHYRFLVIRSVATKRQFVDYARYELVNFGFTGESSMTIAYQQSDLENQLSVQYDSVYKFNSVSSDIKDFIVKFLSVDFPEKEVTKMLGLLAKGRG